MKQRRRQQTHTTPRVSRYKSVNLYPTDYLALRKLADHFELDLGEMVGIMIRENVKANGIRVPK
jgi:hypothetical protein